MKFVTHSKFPPPSPNPPPELLLIIVIMERVLNAASTHQLLLHSLTFDPEEMVMLPRPPLGGVSACSFLIPSSFSAPFTACSRRVSGGWGQGGGSSRPKLIASTWDRSFTPLILRNGLCWLAGTV